MASSRGVLSRWWRVSLRAKGVAVLAVPMAALFAALFTISWVEGDVGEADATVVRAYHMRGDLVDLRSSLLDAQTAVSGYLATGEKRFLTILRCVGAGDRGDAVANRRPDERRPERA
jgi:hypothetical protein